MQNETMKSMKSKKIVITEIAMEWYQIMIKDNLLINEFIEMFDLRKMPFNEKKALFRYYMNIFKTTEPELYNYYVCQYQEMVNSKMDIIKQNLKAIICGLRCGKWDNDGIRAFDIIDYYVLLNGYPDDLIHNVLLDNFSSDDVRLFSAWFGLRRKSDFDDLYTVDYEQSYINKFIDESSSYICSSNMRGNKVEEGIVRVLSPHEKITVICFLKNNNIPIYPATINAAVKRFYYLNKEEIPNVKKKTKKDMN